MKILSTKTILVVFLSLFLASCFENPTKVSGKQSVQNVMEQRQSVASTYARSMQLHASAVIDVLMDQAQQQSGHVSDLSESGSIQGLSFGGVIDNQAFAALDASGEGALNTGRQRDLMQSGYCDGVLYTWIAGEFDEEGNIQKARIKGLGESGLGAIAYNLEKFVGNASYGVYRQNALTTPAGANVAINCAEMAGLIPEGSPVLFQEMASEFELSRSGSFYEFENRVCIDPTEEGFDRYRRLVYVDYDTNGIETGRDTDDWELFLQSCHSTEASERISVDLGASSVDQVDFSALVLNDATIKPVVCFQAATTQKNEDGINQYVENGVTFNNCQSAAQFEAQIAAKVQISCGSDPIRTEMDTRACTGAGWDGTVTYQREVYMCTRTDNGHSEQYEKRGAWERSAVNCYKEEVTTASCPFGSGLVNYSRTNRITNEATLEPTNPSWEYINDSCDTDEVFCVAEYAGNREAFSTVANGAFTPPSPELTSVGDYCGTGVICEVEREAECDGGTKTERSRYTCGSGWSDWEDYETSSCAPEQICTPDGIETETTQCEAGFVGTQTRTRTCSSDGSEYSDWSYWDTSGCTQQICTPNDPDVETTSCPTGYSGTQSRVRYCEADGTGYGAWSAWDTSSCVGDICTAGEVESQSASCPAGYNGTQTRNRTCNADGSGYGAWSAWDTSSCVAQVCTAGDVDSETASCPAGYNGTQTRNRTCNADGSGYGAWSAWDTSSCVAQVCTAGTVQSQSYSCGSGYTGDQTRSRTCNASGTGYGSWSTWNRASCNLVVNVYVTDTSVDTGDAYTVTWDAPAADECHISPNYNATLPSSGSTTYTQPNAGSYTHRVECSAQVDGVNHEGSDSVTVIVSENDNDNNNNNNNNNNSNTNVDECEDGYYEHQLPGGGVIIYECD